jgi:hypothetical protein
MHGPEAFSALLGLPEACLAEIEPELIRIAWVNAVRQDARPALLVAAKVPTRVREVIGHAEMLREWGRLASHSLSSGLLVLKQFQGEDLARAMEAQFAALWQADTSRSTVRLLAEATPGIAAHLDPMVVQVRWASLIAPASVEAIKLLRQLPREVAEMLRSEDVLKATHYLWDADRRVRVDGTGPGDPWPAAPDDSPAAGGVKVEAQVAPPWVLSELPKRYQTADFADVARLSFDHWCEGDNTQLASCLLALGEMSPAMRKNIPPEGVLAAWRELARGEAQEEGTDLIALLHSLPEEMTQGLTPEEVRAVFEKSGGSRRRSDPAWALYDIGKLPPRLRPWAGADLVRDLYDQMQSRPTGMEGILAVVEIPDDLADALPEDAVARTIDFVSGWALGGWISHMGRELHQAEAEKSAPRGTVHLARAFARLARSPSLPQSALLNFSRGADLFAPYVPRNVVLAAWRNWLARGNENDVLAALAWAGAPGLEHAMPKDERADIAEAYRPDDLADEVRRAVLEQMESEPEDALGMLARLPDGYPWPVLTRGDVEGVWARLIEAGQLLRAVLLLEKVPVALRPRPTAGELAALLASEDAQVRLVAIRLASNVRASGPAPSAARPGAGRSSTVSPVGLPTTSPPKRAPSP